MPESQDREVLSELVDLYDATNKPLGTTKRLEDVHRDGDWHRSFHCWIVNPKVDQGAVLLQWRGEWKRNWPGRVDTSAAGHYAAGEGIEGGLRELEEEIGVSANLGDLIDAGIRVAIEESEEGVANHEFQDVRLLVDDRELTDYRVEYPEVGGLLFLPIQAGLALLSGEKDIASGMGFLLEEAEEGQGTERHEQVFELTRSNFIPSIDRFAFKAFILADRVLRGEGYLQV